MFTKSIRWRLQLWLAFLLVSILSGFGFTAYQLHRLNRFQQIDEELERRVAALSDAVRGRPPFGQPPGRPPFEPGLGGPPPRRGGPESPGFHGPPEARLELRSVTLSAATLSLFDETDPGGFYYAIWSRGGTLLKHSTNALAPLDRPGRPEAGTRIHTQVRAAHREAYQFTEVGDCLLVGRSIVADGRGLRRFAGWLLAAGSGVLALGLGGGWLLASRAIRPVEDISAAASRISAGNLAERINVAETDSELGRLAGVLNSTFARLEAAFAQQKQFTADASHELRTPIAVILAEAQTTLARERDAAEYRETIEICLAAAQQMRRLTRSLLELARFDAGQEELAREPVALEELTRAAVELIRPLAEARGIRLGIDLEPAATVGDADRLAQVITNLLSNAVHYNRDQGEIRVVTRRENGAARVSVTDTGPGIAAAEVPRLFERFYRGDPSRARADGRQGLGLAIAKAVVDAHGGSLEVTSEPGVGSTFTVRLPG
jgi:heavy metal sensor kinase